MLRQHRIIIDTNLWISFLISKQFSFLDNLIERNKVKLIFSDDLIADFLEVIRRPKLSIFFSEEDLNHLLEIIDQKAEFVNVTSFVDVCRDSNDNFLLALAKDGDADYLITGDKDLLIIKKFENTDIITIADSKILITSRSKA